MRKIHLFLVLIFLGSSPMQSQKATAKDVLDKAIAYHDPNNSWQNFKGTFQVLMETPNSSNRLSTITLDHPKEFFKLSVEKDGVQYSYILNGGDCSTSLNGTNEITEDDRKKYRLTCERGQMMRNYYTYLYGLPMKLRDPGTLLDPNVLMKKFKGKEYLVLKVNYDEEVGKDVWYFYFDPNTYAMEVYQFFHDESKNDGEYILLEGLEEIQGVKMPKVRAWYMNRDDKYLGTDFLKN